MTRGAHEEQQQAEATRLLDEIEQLRTALEASSGEAGRLADDRDRLLRQVAEQARQLQAVHAARAEAAVRDQKDADETAVSAHDRAAEQEEVRTAFAELQVLSEELEVANESLHAANRELDARVEARTRELRAKNAALTTSELRFRTLVEGIPQLVWRAGHDGDWTWASPQWGEYTGLSTRDSLGIGWLQALHPEDRDPARAAWERARAGAPLEMAVRLYHRAGDRYRHYRIRAILAKDERGRAHEWLGTCTDVDDLLQLQERQHVLVAELQHRTRNLMSVVRALALQSLARSADLDDFRARFLTRLEALARVQGLLSRLAEGDRITFSSLLRAELSALQGELDTARVTLRGPEQVALRSSSVQTLALAIHELGTNALKHGALAQAQGRLTVTWLLAPGEDGKPWLMIEWHESGIVMANGAAASRGGAGRELIERALPYQLGARTSYALTEDGVRCTIALPASERTPRSDPAERRAG